MAVKRRWGALVAAAVLGVTAPASAYHDEVDRLTDETAYTLPHRRLRLGPSKLQYGVADRLTVGSYVWPWLLFTPNAHAKWRLWTWGRFDLSTELGAATFDTRSLKRLDDRAGSARLWIVPFELTGSQRFNDRFTLSGSAVFTGIRLQGQLANDALGGNAALFGDNGQLTSTLEYRVSRTFAWVFHLRFLLYQRLRATGDAVLQPDPFTKIELFGSGQSDRIDFRGAASGVLSGVWSWDAFHLRAGLGYGHFNVPIANIVLEKPTLIPQLDFYWVIGRRPVTAPAATSVDVRPR